MRVVAAMMYAVGPQPSGQQQLNIPPAPQKPVADRTYGNTDRAAIIGGEFSKSSQGNANLYVSENSDGTVTVDVRLLQDASPYEIAGTMANLTYAIDSFYSMVSPPGKDILLNVYDTSGNTITKAKFSNSKNAFDYYNVPESAQAGPQQPPSGAQPSYGRQPAGRQPAGGGPSYGRQPAYGGGQQPYYQ